MQINAIVLEDTSFLGLGPFAPTQDLADYFGVCHWTYLEEQGYKKLICWNQFLEDRRSRLTKLKQQKDSIFRFVTVLSITFFLLDKGQVTFGDCHISSNSSEEGTVVDCVLVGVGRHLSVHDYPFEVTDAMLVSSTHAPIDEDLGVQLNLAEPYTELEIFFPNGQDMHEIETRCTLMSQGLSALFSRVASLSLETIGQSPRKIFSIVSVWWILCFVGHAAR